MKKTFLLITLISVSIISNAQQTASQLLRDQVIKILQSDGLLLTDQQKALTGDQRSVSLWKNKRIKAKWLINDEKLKSRLLTKFQPPPFLDSTKVVNSGLIFKDKSIGLIGSYIIRNNDLSIINNSSVRPGFPVLISGTQISVFNPSDDGSNFVLNYTSSKAFEGGVDAKADASFKDYFKAKLQANTDIKNEEDYQISIAAGNFLNQLGVIFDKVNNGQLSALDFGPVYSIFNEYRNGDIRLGDQVIYSFVGVCFFSSKGVKNKDIQKYSVAASSSLNYAFLSLSGSANSQWTNASNFTTQTNIYNVYMFSTPQLIAIPTINDILRVWNNLTPNGSSITFPTTHNIPANSPLIAKVIFGPIPNNDMLPLIKIDENFSKAYMKNNPFIDHIKIITDDPKRITPNSDGYYTFDLEISRNNPYIQNAYTTIGPLISANIPIKIYIDNPVGTDTLKKIYDNVTILTDRYPIPQMDNFELTANKSDDSYSYKSSVTFTVPTNNPMIILNNPQPIKVTQIFGLPASVDEALSTDIKSSTFTLKDNNKFDMIFNISNNAKYFDINHRSYDIELLLEFTTNNGFPYKRKIPVRIIGPKDLINTSNTTSKISIKDNTQLLASLNTTALVEPTKTVQDKLTLFTKLVDGKDVLDILSFINELKKFNKIIDNPDNSSNYKYFADAAIIDITKLNK
jgi:hypothetical protein